MIHARFFRGLAAMVILCALGSDSFAQTLSTSAIVGVTNSSISGFIGGLAGDSSNGPQISPSVTHSFTGLDRLGASQTMIFNGQVIASAQYGQLHLTSSGTVTNSYYNAANPVFYDSGDDSFHPTGSPDGLVSLGFAGFDDTLQFGGALQAGYKARYLFHVSGTNSGYGGAADLSVSIAGDPDESFFDFDPGPFSTTWATIDHNINGITPQTIHVQFSNQFVLNTVDVADGSNIIGSSNFSNTLTLAGIIVVDGSGDPVSGVTFTSGSGTVYAPEPTTLALVIPAALGLLRRQRRTKPA